MYLENIITKEELKSAKEQYDTEIRNIEKQIDNETNKENLIINKTKQINKIKESLNKIINIKEINESVFSNFISHITAYPNQTLSISFDNSILEPIKIQYTITGKGKNYKTIPQIIE